MKKALAECSAWGAAVPPRFGAGARPARGLLAFEAALDALRLDPERTRAGLLSVAAGMAVIVSLVSIVSGGRREMLRAVEAAGPSNVFLRTERSTRETGPPALTTADLASEAARLPALLAAGGARVLSREVRAGAFRATVPVYAVDEGIFAAFPLRSSRGRMLGELDFRSRAPRALLGASLARLLAPGGDPAGRTIEAGEESYEVVGTLEPLASDAGSGGDLHGIDWDRGLLVPLGAEPARLSAPAEDYPLDLAVLRMLEPAAAERAARLLRGLLDESGRGARVHVSTAGQAMAEYRAAHRSFDRVALLVSLLTAASASFGITNLLRASVRARASEIGLRRAVGARREEIRRQFLVEGVLLGLGGGLLGILVGVAAAMTLLSRAGFRPGFDAATLVLLSGGAVVFGIASGLRPAAEAARVDPGVALRSE